jgi:hypothetical protein
MDVLLVEPACPLSFAVNYWVELKACKWRFSVQALLMILQTLVNLL